MIGRKKPNRDEANLDSMSTLFLISFLAVCLLSGVMGEHFYILPRRNEINLDSLMTELNQPLQPKYIGNVYPESVGKQVAGILARAKHKSTPKAILNKYSVDDLLELNIVELDHCTKSKIQDRENFCEEFISHHNLLQYCMKTVTNLKDWCNFPKNSEVIFVQELNKIEGTKVAEKFLGKIRQHIEIDIKNYKNEIKNQRKQLDNDEDRQRFDDEHHRFNKNSIDYKHVIELILMKNGKPYEDEIKSICKRFTDSLASNYQMSDKYPVDYEDKRFITFFKCCNIINKLSPEDTDISLQKDVDFTVKDCPKHSLSKRLKDGAKDLAHILTVTGSALGTIRSK